jgi:hypothetical protein
MTYDGSMQHKVGKIFEGYNYIIGSFSIKVQIKKL